MDTDSPQAKLQELLAAGKSYYEASELLLKDGYARGQIEDAKIVLDSKAHNTSNQSNVSITGKPEIAADLLHATATMERAKSKARRISSGGYLFFQGGIPILPIKISGNIYWYFIAAIVLLAGFYVFAKHIIK